MSQFEWLLTVAAYLLVAGILFAAVLFVVYQRRRPASHGEGENTGDLANMMILLQTMRDMLEEQKTLARQFNQNFEEKLAHMEEKNRAARQRADELEQRAAKLEGRLQRVREELAALHGDIEAASHGAAQERGPGPLKFSQAGGAGATPPAPSSPAASESSAESQPDETPYELGAALSGETAAPSSPAESADGEAHAQDGEPQALEARTGEERDETGEALSDRRHERYVDRSTPSPDERSRTAEPPLRGTPTGPPEGDPPRGRMPWDSRRAQSGASAKSGSDQETPVKSEEAAADSSSNEEATASSEAREQGLPPRERPALHILASPDNRDDEDEPEQADVPDYWVGLGFANQPGESPPSGKAAKEEGQGVPEPGDPEAARQAFRALLNMGQESSVGTASRTETLDQPSAGEGGEGPLRSRVYEYSDAGMSIAEIASELGIGKGEVRLILSLREQGGR